MEIKLGTNLILQPYDEETDDRFKCKVVDQRDQVILIDYPINTASHRTAFLMEGTRFRASFIDDQKIAYSFRTHVTGREKGNIPMIMLSIPAEDQFEKIQRREYVRVMTPVDVAVLKNNSYEQVVAEDISAGGLAIMCNDAKKYKENEVIEIMIALPFENREEGVRYVETTAQVIRIIERDGTYVIPLKFTETDEIDKQLIIRFCFERQLLIRKKESTI
ncbi:flagellar brake protein [Kurthia sibirica]|uniref:Flagellar brake protein n=1 Tax=Kurthia sibirica TaxID=202750 RepID=A0A2U3AIU4_9BACL|nr:flagellar brake domain-containing protein [Kurthia sibirica]PWI24427.1 flagellar brake protein [Kurthia sibirica]GEK35607.1 hypothetical protein KSI01_31400 [Kurthia sibirica]